MTVHPDGELESLLAESLHQRASLADTHGHGFGEVRRRVRRHRQRQMAAGLLPAVAGFGWIITRPVAHDPLRPGEGASGCDSTLPASTLPAWTGEPSTLPQGATGPYATDVNGNEVLMGTTTTYPFSTVPVSTIEVDGNGNPVSTTVAGISVTQTTWYLDANGNPTATMVVPGTDAVATTIACEEPTTMPPSTAPSDAGDSTTTTSVELQDYSFVLFVNASTVNGAASSYAAQFPGAQRTTGTIRVDTSYVMATSATAGVAQSIANALGIADVRTAGLDASIVAEKELTGIQVVVVIGEGHALSLTSPTTTAIG